MCACIRGEVRVLGGQDTAAATRPPAAQHADALLCNAARVRRNNTLNTTAPSPIIFLDTLPTGITFVGPVVAIASPSGKHARKQLWWHQVVRRTCCPTLHACNISAASRCTGAMKCVWPQCDLVALTGSCVKEAPAGGAQHATRTAPWPHPKPGLQCMGCQIVRARC